jgi:alkylation response protein AidB-like acyl-CoA dehydrogenase
MDSELSPKLRSLLGAARELADTVVAPNADREDAAALWPEPAMRALAHSGLLGLNVPEALGGHGQGLTALVRIAEVLAQASPSTALCYAMHCVGSAVIAAKATDYQKQAYLEPIARGQHITTLALSEPGTGLHFYVPRTRLSRAGDGYIVDGTKSFITNGAHADSYVVSTVDVASGTSEGTFSCVLVDAFAPGLQWDDEWRGFGMRSNSSRTARLNGVHVPAHNLLGAEGDQVWYVFDVVAPYFLSAMSGTYLGTASEAFASARAHPGSRRYAHTGELLAATPTRAHRLGELWTELEATRQLIYSAARRADEADAEALLAILASKAAAGDTAVRVSNEAMTLTGGVSYRENSKLARLLRDARACHVMAPTTDILKTWVGRALVNLPLI